MKSNCVMLLACAGLLATAAAPLRADFMSTAVLTPGADGASNSSGSGTVMVDYNSASGTFSYTLSWMNLTGEATMAHIHIGAPGVSGPIVIPFFMSNMPATDTMSGTLTSADVVQGASPGISTIADVAQAIQNGDAYVNIHTAEYPAGELRGQLAETPEPATAGLALLAAAMAAGILIRRRPA